MPVQFKTATATKVKVSIGSKFEEEIAELVDTFVEQDRVYQEQRTEFEAIQKDRNASLKALVDRYNEHFDDVDVRRQVAGYDHIVELGPKGKTRTIKTGAQATLRALLDKVKKGLFMELATVPLGKLSAYLTEDELAEVIDIERTDTRSVKVIK